MRRPTVKQLGVTAAVLMLGGSGIGVVSSIAQSNCDGTASGGLPGVIAPHSPSCSGYGAAAGVGVALLVLGAALVVAAFVLSAPRFLPVVDAGPDPGDGPDPAPPPGGSPHASANGAGPVGQQVSPAAPGRVPEVPPPPG